MSIEEKAEMLVGGSSMGTASNEKLGIIQKLLS